MFSIKLWHSDAIVLNSKYMICLTISKSVCMLKHSDKTKENVTKKSYQMLTTFVIFNHVSLQKRGVRKFTLLVMMRLTKFTMMMTIWLTRWRHVLSWNLIWIQKWPPEMMTMMMNQWPCKKDYWSLLDMTR